MDKAPVWASLSATATKQNGRGLRRARFNRLQFWLGAGLEAVVHADGQGLDVTPLILRTRTGA
ncbi:MAG: hypothetical protein Q8N75_02040 [Pseudomonadota bacterium]|nr:hypothetical protein [Pseudomonadota bacterium]